MDKTYIKVKGKWHYLYRAIDSSGLTLDIWLRKNRDSQAAYSFFKRLIKQFGEPRVMVTDKAPSLSCAFNRLKFEHLFTKTEHRMSKYLNNIIEQDHRPVKKRNKLYQSIRTASTTIKGIETIHALYKTSRRDGNLFDFSVTYEINQLLGISS
ncbi:Mobile element protein [Vagococcus fluvialis bH819]|uniref:Mobile element protein n=1 Tax=Vagococcus fluvialis bH819 TaxID=1255619 RepID=A0A1X6WRU0_9ENTE|nr:Mobile element protein [Vagococcus fluvialis bH819]